MSTTCGSTSISKPKVLSKPPLDFYRGLYFFAMKTIVIGGGIAGSVLWLKLLERGIQPTLIDKPELSSSSRIAAGVINPVVLKRLKVVSWAADFLPSTQRDYPRWEQLLHASFYHPVALKHLFVDPAEANKWMELSDAPSHAPYLGETSAQTPAAFSRKAGFGNVKQSAWLDTTAFLDTVKQHARSMDLYQEQELTTASYKNFREGNHKIFLCTGHLMRLRIPRFADAFAPTRGEVMIIESDALPQDAIYHGPVFILPLGGNRFKVGATYHWDKLDDITTDEGLATLESKLQKFFPGPYKVVDHQAGVRPNTKDRKPLLGKLEDNLYCFNGLGSRGALMAPYLADRLLDFVFDATPLHPAHDLNRFNL